MTMVALWWRAVYATGRVVSSPCGAAPGFCFVLSRVAAPLSLSPSTPAAANPLLIDPQCRRRHFLGELTQ